MGKSAASKIPKSPNVGPVRKPLPTKRKPDSAPVKKNGQVFGNWMKR
jgi:hypothetical protein